MQRPRRDFLPGSGFAGDQDGRPSSAHQPDDLRDLPHLPAVPDQRAFPAASLHTRRQTAQIVASILFDGFLDCGKWVIVLG